MKGEKKRKKNDRRGEKVVCICRLHTIYSIIINIHRVAVHLVLWHPSDSSSLVLPPPHDEDRFVAAATEFIPAKVSSLPPVGTKQNGVSTPSVKTSAGE